MQVTGRLARFGIAGALGFVVDYGVLKAGTLWLGLDSRLVRVVSLAAAMTATWLINRNLTFADRKVPATWREYLAYVSASLFGAAINYGVFVLLMTISPVFATRPLLTLAVATAISMGVNYLNYSRAVFARRS